MKSSLLFLALLVLSAQHVPAQTRGEFESHPNGLIYSEATMASLHRIVDSMNLRFRKCDPWKEYRALSQAIGHYVQLDTGDVQGAIADMKGGLSFDAFRRKYPLASVDDSQLVIRRHEPAEDDRAAHTSFTALEMRAYGGHSVDVDDTLLVVANLRGRWVFKHYPRNEWSSESVAAFYFPAAFRSEPLPERFARSVQYADCMIDTAVDVFFPAALASSRWEPENKTVVGDAYKAWLDKVSTIGIPPEPKRDEFMKTDSGSDAYFDALRASRDRRHDAIHAALQRDASLRAALKAVAMEAQSTGNPDAELEVFAERHLSASEALMLKRGRLVWGSCSQDRSPRYHALSIARLAAESVSWDVFLRAHLNILNDRFPRATDGSYAWAERQTYLRELEELDFDVAELMMGTTYRVANPSGHHYYGSIPRQGRALAEYSQPSRIEARMAADVADTTLDDYNRMMAYYLFLAYAHHCPEGPRKTAATAALKTVKSTLPGYLQRRLKE